MILDVSVPPQMCLGPKLGGKTLFSKAHLTVALLIMGPVLEFFSFPYYPTDLSPTLLENLIIHFSDVFTFPWSAEPDFY